MNLTLLLFIDPEGEYTSMEEEIWFYRDIARPFQTPHHCNSESWAFAPFPINPVTCFT